MTENQLEFISKSGRISKTPINSGQNNEMYGTHLDLELEERYQRSESNGSNVDAKEFIKGLMRIDNDMV